MNILIFIMNSNNYFLESKIYFFTYLGPKIRLNKINQNLLTPKQKADVSIQKFTKTLPDERTTTNNLSRRIDSSVDKSNVKHTINNRFQI